MEVGIHRTHPEAQAAAPPDLECRVCELEAENARLLLLVGELLTANQRLREADKAVAGSASIESR